MEALLLPLGVVAQSEAKTEAEAEEEAEAELRCERGLSWRLCLRRRHRPSSANCLGLCLRLKHNLQLNPCS